MTTPERYAQFKRTIKEMRPKGLIFILRHIDGKLHHQMVHMPSSMSFNEKLELQDLYHECLDNLREEYAPKKELPKGDIGMDIFAALKAVAAPSGEADMKELDCPNVLDAQDLDQEYWDEVNELWAEMMFDFIQNLGKERRYDSRVSGFRTPGNRKNNIFDQTDQSGRRKTRAELDHHRIFHEDGGAGAPW